MSREYIYRFGVAKRLKQNVVTIILQKQMLKKSCSGCSLCATDIPAVELKLRMAAGSAITQGDIVSVGTIELNEAEAALLAFGLPLAWAISSYFVMTVGLRWDGDSGVTVGLTLLAGVIGLFSVFVADKVLRSIYPPRLSKVEKMPDEFNSTGESCSV